MEKGKKAGLFRTEVMAPLLLSTVVLSATAYIYACGNASAVMLFLVVSAVYSSALFAMYEKLRSAGKTWLSTVIILIVFMAVMMIAPLLADMRGLGDFGLWFMEPTRYTSVHFGNTYTLILVFGFVLVSCLYYFTRVRYRGVFVFLICLCPFCLFAKTFTDIPVIFPIVVMTLFFFIMAGNSGAKTVMPEYGKGVLKATLAFVLAVTVIASFFPKMKNAPFRENFDEFITGVSIGAEGIADFGDFSENSSAATSRSDDEDVVLSFYGDNPRYVKRQCFNLYDRVTGTWGYYGDDNNGSSNWKRYTRYEEPSVLYYMLGYDDTVIDSKKSWVRYASGKVRAVYTVDNTTEIDLYNSDSDIYRTELDEYFLSREDSEKVNSYVIEWAEFPLDNDYIADSTDEYFKRIADGKTVTGNDDGSYVPSEEDVRKYGEVLADDAQSYLRSKEQAQKYNDYLLSDEVMDGCYSSADARAKVRMLAESVTAGCVNDAQRAAAVVDMFRNGEYIYDDEFTTANAAPDNFIFGTKRGACAAYATAMTLMCRELGMTARYCEGFLVQKQDESGSFWFVTAADSHAFVQVWINGYGWTTFDPTSNVKDDGYFDVTFVYVGVGAAVIFIIGALFVLLRPRFEESRFVSRMKRARGTAQYSMIYKKINAMTNIYTGNGENRLTPFDTADKCNELFGFDISDFVRKYEDAVYGGKADEQADNSAVYTGFVGAYNKARREERRFRKKWGYSPRKK